MPKLEEKQKVVQQLQDRIDKASLIIFTDYRGLNVEEMTSLRNRLRIPGVEYRVVKNTMMEFALGNCGYNEIVNQIDGPNAVLFSDDDLVTPAKAIYEFIKERKKLEVKVGIVQGQVVAADRIKALADLPPKEVLLAQVVGTMQAPITSLVYVLNANISGLARALDQIRVQKAAG
ncbi:MAG TPA: 50S ribosomal protein L10 [Syntrophomonas sp.]|mgnify:FL=1|jgi:large subunit ribosomal protein L10|nr:50S ribosomal protein L10 [Syntrophomonas sp.]